MSNTVKKFESEIKEECIFTLSPDEIFLMLHMLTRPAKTQIHIAEHIRKIKIKCLENSPMMFFLDACRKIKALAIARKAKCYVYQLITQKNFWLFLVHTV